MFRIIALMFLCGAVTLFAATTTIGPGDNLQLAFDNATVGDTIIIQGGTYQVPPGETNFHIDKAITVDTDLHLGQVTLQAPAGAPVGLAIHSSGVSVIGGMIINGGTSGVIVRDADGQSALSGITLIGLTVNPSSTGLGHGIYLFNASNVTLNPCTVESAAVHGIYVSSPANTFTNNVAIKAGGVSQSGSGYGIFIERSHNAYLFQTRVSRSQQHGIYFSSSSNGTIENSTVESAGANGIFLDLNSDNNLVMGNIVRSTDTQYAFAVKNSKFNTLVANTVTGFHGIQLIGASDNRVEKNSIKGHQYDGIVLTPGDAGPTQNNYIAKNVIESTGLSAGRPDGTGIWLNEGSNGNYIFGNQASGVVEAGLTSFNSSYSYIKGNELSGNGQAGILWWNYSTVHPPPTNTVFHYNYSHDNRTNANFLMRGGNNNDIAHNFLSGTNNPVSPKADGGIMFQNWTQPGGQASGGSSGNQIYLNIVKDLAQGNNVDGSTNNTNFFQNRYINTAQQFSLQPAGVQWDASRFLGGNYWNGLSASGNPSTGDVSFFNFIIDSAGHLSTATGPYEDKFPYVSDNLGKSGAIAITLPAAGAVMAAGSQKTIAWKSLGCVFVNISYNSGGGPPQAIVSNYPDFGFYHWTLPSNLTPGTNYTIQMTCLNRSGAAFGPGGTSGVFTVGAGDLVLLSPGPELMANAGSTVRVGWKKSGTVTGLNVLLSSDGGAYTVLASNVNVNTAGYVNVTLPNVNTNRARILVQATNNTNFQDGTDGFFAIRSGTPVFTSPVASTTSLDIGSVIELEWISRQNSYYVDLDLWNAGVFQSIVANLPDYGKFTWFVPELWMTGAYIRATFKDANRNVIGTVNTNPFSIFYTSSPGSRVPFYRLYSDVTKEHLYTTDQNEYNVLGTRGWTQEGLLGQIASGPMNISGVLAIPFYRLYDDRILNHLWTTDRNEYFTLRQFPNYHAEGVVGYLFPTPVTLPGCSGPNCASLPFHRLVFKFPPHYHLWTTDQNEVNVLTAPNGGWISEGVVGHLFSTGAPQVTSAPIIITKNSGSAVKSTGSSKTDSSAAAPSVLAEAHGVTTRASRLKAVVNGASYEAGEIALGQTVSLFGEGLGPENPMIAEFTMGAPIRRELGGTRVLFDGSPAPLLYSSSGEVKAIVPNEIAGKDSVQVEVHYQDHVSDPMEVKIAPSSPGIFTMDLSGKGQAVAFNQNGDQNSAQNPADRGSVIALFATGEGLGEPALETGELPSTVRLPQPMQPVTVEIGGLRAELVYAGAAPGLPGAMQVRVRIPEALEPGMSVPVTFTVGTQSSQRGVTVSIR